MWNPEPATRKLAVTARTFILYNIFRPALRIALHPFFRTEFHGVENIPQTGPVILTPNHVAYLDPFWVGLVFRRPVWFMTWHAAFGVAPLRPFLQFFECFPVDLNTGIDKSALVKAQDVLRNGHMLVIFPEGGRSDDGHLRPSKTGAFRLAMRLNVPVVPVTVCGGFEAWPKHNLLPRPGKIDIYYHPPQMFTAAPSEIKTKSHEAADRVRELIASRLAPDTQADLPENPLPPPASSLYQEDLWQHHESSR